MATLRASSAPLASMPRRLMMACPSVLSAPPARCPTQQALTAVRKRVVVIIVTAIIIIDTLCHRINDVCVVCVPISGLTSSGATEGMGKPTVKGALRQHGFVYLVWFCGPTA